MVTRTLSGERLRLFPGQAGLMEDHGKPILLYNDKHSAFRINRTDTANGGGQGNRFNGGSFRRG